MTDFRRRGAIPGQPESTQSSRWSDKEPVIPESNSAEVAMSPRHTNVADLTPVGEDA